MNRDHFWLSEVQFSLISPHLPTDARGKARVDDRRVISGIIHVLKSGRRWIYAPPNYGPKKTLYNRYVRWAEKGVWSNLFHALAGAGGPPVHALTDEYCRPLAFIMTGGQVADCTTGSALLQSLPPCEILRADKGFDSNALRRQAEERGTMPNIPPKANRIWKNCFSPVLYRYRNAIERMFCRLKDFRRVATRYDRNAAICIAATVSFWL